MFDLMRSGRTSIRPVLFLAGAAIAAGAVTFGFRVATPEMKRDPGLLPNSNATAPTDSVIEGVKFVYNGVPAESLLVDTIPPSRPSRLLFFQGRAVQPDYHGGGLMIDGSGGLLTVDENLQVRRLTVHLDGREVASVAAGPNRSLWLVIGDGSVVRVKDEGTPVTDVVRGPFLYSLIASDQHGQAWLVRSPDRTGFRPAFGSTSLLARLDSAGNVANMVGSGVIPKDFLLTHLASAGRITVSDSVIHYAPFIRDEVIAMSVDGDTSWVAIRGLPQSEPEPRIEVIDNEPAVDYAPVNLGIAEGLDGKIYVLSIPGFTTSQSRLDVFDAASGQLMRSTTINNALPTLAADRDGRVYAIDEFELLTGVPASKRQPFAEFNMESLTGQRVSSSDLRGKVTLINFWASWCAPCRVEMPALDSLYKGIDDSDFVFLTMNEDVSTARAEGFIDEYGFDFPVLLGRGNLRETYHYVGLPFTVLIDRFGRVVQRWTGFAGDEQISAIRGVIEAELARGTTDESPDTAAHTGH